jgi:beta-xylosidase
MKSLYPWLFLLPFALNVQFNQSTNQLTPAEKTGYDTTIIHPVIPGDFADPSVIRVGDTYYATGTSSEWAPHYPLFTSTDLIHWKQLGYIFPKTPSWASSSFWAPELFYYNDTYYVYYTARKKADGISCIGVATSKDPEQGFTDHGIVVEFGKEAIDPFIIKENGKLYITFKAYGLNDRPIELLGYQLTDDGLKTEGEPFMLLRDDEKKGLEGQCIVKRNNYYYLFYSAGGCCGSKCSYHLDVARASSLRGPYTKFESNPVLAGYDNWKCTGHGTIVSTPKGEDFYLYHAYNKQNDVFTGRQGMLAKVSWNNKTGWPKLQPISGAKPGNFRDDFSNDTLKNTWQWDFRHSTPRVKIENGALHLSGQTTANNIFGTALTVRPFESNYEISTAVLNQNASLKGLTFYGDADQSAGIGIKNDTLQVWYVKDDVRNILKEFSIKNTTPIYLQIKVEEGDKLRFFWSDVAVKWNEVSTGEDYLMADFAAPWDRTPRPGLLQQGTESAVFDFFEIKYN